MGHVNIGEDGEEALVSDACPDWCQLAPGHGGPTHDARLATVPVGTVDDAGLVVEADDFSLVVRWAVGSDEPYLYAGSEREGGQHIRLTLASAQRLADAMHVYLTTQL